MSNRSKYLEIAKVFLKIGATGFGGPLATISMMEQTCVRERKWLAPEQFSEMFTICKAMPGPVGALMAIFFGRTRGGTIGGMISGICYILPAFFIMILLAASFSSYSEMAGVKPFLTGLQISSLAIIFVTAINLAKPLIKNFEFWLIALFSALVVFVRPGIEPLLIFSAGLAHVLVKSKIANRSQSHLFDLGALTWVCFKAGAFVFGTGLAIVPLLQSEVVEEYKWLSHSEFLNALAFGQITPGPVVISATYIGYKVSGVIGALVATVAIFSASFVNMLFILPRILSRLRGKPHLNWFIQWALPVVIGGVFATSIGLCQKSLGSISEALLFVACLSVLLKTKTPAWLLVLGSGVFWAILTAL
jgi:chromate transporter